MTEDKPNRESIEVIVPAYAFVTFMGMGVSGVAGLVGYHLFDYGDAPRLFGARIAELCEDEGVQDYLTLQNQLKVGYLPSTRLSDLVRYPERAEEFDATVDNAIALAQDPEVQEYVWLDARYYKDVGGGFPGVFSGLGVLAGLVVSVLLHRYLKKENAKNSATGTGERIEQSELENITEEIK
jgi:hypothetical protein